MSVKFIYGIGNKVNIKAANIPAGTIFSGTIRGVQGLFLRLTGISDTEDIIAAFHVNGRPDYPVGQIFHGFSPEELVTNYQPRNVEIHISGGDV